MQTGSKQPVRLPVRVGCRRVYGAWLRGPSLSTRSCTCGQRQQLRTGSPPAMPTTFRTTRWWRNSTE